MNMQHLSHTGLAARFSRAVLVGLTALVAACGGGGGGGSTGPIGGIEGTGFAVGGISGFGSVFVNGVEFTTTNATITLNGRTGAAESELKVGYVVRVRGTINANGTTGTASAIDYQNEVKGQVTGFSDSASTITVLGQTVVIVGTTLLDSSLAGLAPSEMLNKSVEVSGFRDPNGNIRATRIEEKVIAAGEFEVKGTVANLDTVARTFTIGSITVAYGNLTVPANGNLVEVKGSLSGNTLTATRLEIENRTVGATNGDKLEVQGYITTFTSISDFEVNGQRVSTSGSTQFPNGTTSIVAGAKVEVEGTVNSSGVLVATKVKLEDEGSTRVTGRVTAVNGAANTLSVVGVAGQVISATFIEDKSSAQLRPFNLTRLNVGDYVEIRGRELTSPANTVEVYSLERRTFDTRVEVRAKVQSADTNTPKVRLLGLDILVVPGNGGGSTECRDAASARVDCATLFGQVVAGTTVLKVRATDADVGTGSITADRIEVETGN